MRRTPAARAARKTLALPRMLTSSCEARAPRLATMKARWMSASQPRRCSPMFASRTSARTSRSLPETISGGRTAGALPRAGQRRPPAGGDDTLDGSFAGEPAEDESAQLAAAAGDGDAHAAHPSRYDPCSEAPQILGEEIRFGVGFAA